MNLTGTLSRAIAMMLPLALMACGGGGSSSTPPPPPPPPPPATFTIGGTVTGLNGALVLRNNGADDLSVSADGTFAFGTALQAAAAYDVTVATQPANQSCTVGSGTGTVGNANVTTVTVTCAALASLAITSLSPTHGPADTLVTLTGAGFSTTLTDNVVSLNNMPCTVRSATATELTVVIPANAGSGNLQVTVNSSTVASPVFTYDTSFVTVSTLAGAQLGYQDGTGSAARFYSPSGLAFDAAGILHVSDPGNQRIRTVNSAGVVGTFLGNGTQGAQDGTGTGPATGPQFHDPLGLAFDIAGNLYIADFNNASIRKSTPAGVVTTIANSASGLGLVEDVVVDGAGTVYISDTSHSRIARLEANGTVTTLAGSGTRGSADGMGSAAQFNLPAGVAVCPDGNLYVADEYNHSIRKVTPAGEVTTYTGGGGGPSTIVDGTLADARFFFPRALACDAQGKLFVVDTGNERIRMITPSGWVTTLAGMTSPGFADGDGATAQFSLPQDIAIDADGSLLIADGANQRIRKIVWR